MDPTHLYFYAASGFIAVLLIILWILRVPEDHEPTYTNLKTQVAEFGEWKIRYHRSGSGPTMVLVHGISASLFCWRPVIPRLSEEYDVIALDLPGHGESSMPAHATFGIDDQVERLRLFLDHLGIKECYWVGNSMGCNITMAFALTYPERTLGVTAIAPAASSRLVPLPYASFSWMAGPLSWLVTRKLIQRLHMNAIQKRERLSDGRITESLKVYRRNPAAIRSVFLASAAIRDRRLPGLFKELKIPVLILWGTRDSLVSRKVIEDLKAILPQAESYVHEGGGHHLQEDEPEWVQEKILEFFSRKTHSR